MTTRCEFLLLTVQLSLSQQLLQLTVRFSVRIGNSVAPTTLVLATWGVRLGVLVLTGPSLHIWPICLHLSHPCSRNETVPRLTALPGGFSGCCLSSGFYWGTSREPSPNPFTSFRVWADAANCFHVRRTSSLRLTNHENPHQAWRNPTSAAT